jgi:hypothetical protein
VLRTFKRVDMIAARYSSEAIAKALVERGVDLGGAHEYLSDVADDMRELQRKAGVNPNAHPNGPCAQCGKECDHNGARCYCSRECRQRAYRVRKAAAEGRNSPIPKRKRWPTAREAAIAEVKEMFDRQKEALAFANTMYALHLKAHPVAMARRATPLDDASITPGDETTVTPSEPARA